MLTKRWSALNTIERDANLVKPSHVSTPFFHCLMVKSKTRLKSANKGDFKVGTYEQHLKFNYFGSRRAF